MEIRGYITHLFLRTYSHHAGTFKLSLSSRTAGRMVQVASDSITLPTDLARRSMAQNSELEGHLSGDCPFSQLMIFYFCFFQYIWAHKFRQIILSQSYCAILCTSRGCNSLCQTPILLLTDGLNSLCMYHILYSIIYIIYIYYIYITI